MSNETNSQQSRGVVGEEMPTGFFPLAKPESSRVAECTQKYMSNETNSQQSRGVVGEEMPTAFFSLARRECSRVAECTQKYMSNETNSQQSQRKKGEGHVAGVDEAGRGPLVGPVFAAAVILDPARPIPGLNDSKKLSPKKREYFFSLIQEKALAFCIADVSALEIDRINILQATLLGMKKAVEGLSLAPDEVWVDGNQKPTINYPCKTIVKGDALIPAISAASILAKVARDRLMEELDKVYPCYQFAKHKGYPTRLHMEMLKKYGPCEFHRRSFAPVRQFEIVGV